MEDQETTWALGGPIFEFMAKISRRDARRLGLSLPITASRTANPIAPSAIPAPKRKRRRSPWVPPDPTRPSPEGWIEIVLDGAPVPKERHRFGRGRVYGATRTTLYEKRLRAAALAAMAGRAPIAGPVEADLLMVLAVPKGWSKARRADALAGRVLPLRRPDGDNVSKAVLDGLNRVVFRDDAQVVDLRIRKRYGQETGVWLRLRAIPGAEGPPRRRCQQHRAASEIGSAPSAEGSRQTTGRVSRRADVGPLAQARARMSQALS